MNEYQAGTIQLANVPTCERVFDGKRVKAVLGTTTTAFVGGYYEVTGNLITKYYAAGGTRIAMRTDSSFYWLVGDHLGSTSIIADAAGVLQDRVLYKAWGEVRYPSGPVGTRYTYTGQYAYNTSGANDFGLMYYGARFYDPYLNRWLQPDSIIPDPYNPQSYDRYAYTRNNPVLYNDPTGHWVETFFDIAFIVYDIYQIYSEGWTPVNTAALAADVACAIAPVATGGGPVVRAAVAGGEVIEKTAVHLPEIIKLGQGVEKLFQYIDSGNGDDPFTNNDSSSNQSSSNDRKYVESTKHDPNHGWGSPMDLDKATAQEVLNKGIPSGKQIYSYYDGNVYVFQPDNAGGYHGYNITNTAKVPTSVLRSWRESGVITDSQYTKMYKWSHSR